MGEALGRFTVPMQCTYVSTPKCTGRIDIIHFDINTREDYSDQKLLHVERYSYLRCPLAVKTTLPYKSLWFGILPSRASGKAIQPLPGNVPWDFGCCLPFEKKLLACYWAFVKSKPVIQGGFNTLQLGISVLGWIILYLLIKWEGPIKTCFSIENGIFKNVEGLAPAVPHFSKKRWQLFYLGEPYSQLHCL